jgi:phosphatidylglycerol lysyltransferase
MQDIHDIHPPVMVGMSPDIIRMLALAAAVMDYLFIALLLWGKDIGYEWFNLGMAPFSGLDASPIAPLWNRIGAFVFNHGETVYNFQGLRHYKEKFDPVWSPRYLASPGGLAMPVVFSNLASLISGGVKGMLLP